MTRDDAIKFRELMQSLSILFPGRDVDRRIEEEYFSVLSEYEFDSIQEAARKWSLRGKRFPYVSDLVSFMR